jgi:hypothetical protein
MKAGTIMIDQEMIQAMPIREYMAGRYAKAKRHIEELTMTVNRFIATRCTPNDTPLPSEDQIGSMPRMAQLSFGTRCTRRLLPLVLEDFEIWTDCNSSVELVEKLASLEKGWNDPLYSPTAHKLRENYTELKGIPIDSLKPGAQMLLVATLILIETALDDANDCYITAEAHKKISLISRLSWTGQRSGINSICNDFSLLVTGAKEESWDDNTPVSPEFFVCRSAFDISSQIQKSSIIEISPVIAEQLIAYLREDPQHFYELTGRQFEELIARLFAKFGFEATLLAQTRDGGRDIIAVDTCVLHNKYLIECKRYNPPRKVGIAPVQRLHGVVQGEGATKGIIVTTTLFTLPASNFIEQHKWQLEGCDFQRLMEWLKIYDKATLVRDLDKENLRG